MKLSELQVGTEYAVIPSWTYNSKSARDVNSVRENDVVKATLMSKDKYEYEASHRKNSINDFTEAQAGNRSVGVIVKAVDSNNNEVFWTTRLADIIAVYSDLEPRWQKQQADQDERERQEREHRERIEKIKANDAIKKTIKPLDSKSIALALNIPYDSVEGQLFPDTYYFSRNTPDIEILRRAYQAMQKKISYEWQHRSEEVPYKNSYEALIMASIIEKETGKSIEANLISGVFIHRLSIGMKLQSDPTVIYGLGKNFTRSEEHTSELQSH